MKKTSDSDRMTRLTNNITKLLSELLKHSVTLEKKTKPLRLKINVDLKALIKETPPKDRKALNKLIAAKVQAIFDSKGSPKVGTTEGCVGQPGGGVSVSDGDFFGGACAIAGEGGGITGGGVEVGFHY